MVGEGADEGFTFAVDLGFIYLQGFREAGGRDRFARGEEHGHQRALEIILFHNGSLSGADRLVRVLEVGDGRVVRVVDRYGFEFT